MSLDIQAYRTRLPYSQQPPPSRTILVEYVFVPASLAGFSTEKREFTEDACIKVAMMNGWGKVIIGGYPHCTTVLEGVKIQCDNHITATFGQRTSESGFASHIHCSDASPYELELNNEGRVRITSTKTFLGERNVVHQFWVKAWVDKTKDTGMVERLRWARINAPEQEVAKKKEMEEAAKQKDKKKELIMSSSSWRAPTAPAQSRPRISSAFASGKMGQFVSPTLPETNESDKADKTNKKSSEDCKQQ